MHQQSCTIMDEKLKTLGFEETNCSSPSHKKYFKDIFITDRYAFEVVVCPVNGLEEVVVTIYFGDSKNCNWVHMLDKSRSFSVGIEDILTECYKDLYEMMTKATLSIGEKVMTLV